MSQSRVEQLWESSQAVLRDCALPNGAIVAANSDRHDYPASAESYRFVWPRDAAFQLVAGRECLPPSEAGQIRDRFLGWLATRAQLENGVIVKRYSVNGPLDIRYGTEYQPDQAGALLWALAETQELAQTSDRTGEATMRRLANGLTAQWRGEDFRVPTQDLWENRRTNPEAEEVFTYSIAAAAHGLGRAIGVWRGRTGETDAWLQAKQGMEQVLQGVMTPHYLRKMHPSWAVPDTDNSLDASLSGLVYPFAVEGSKEVIQRRDETVRLIAQKLLWAGKGTERYLADTYDGIARITGEEAAAGGWPLLTFWNAASLSCIGLKELAVEMHADTVAELDECYKDDRLPNNLIPEQIFGDRRDGQAVLPLGWSHAKFVIATARLGLRS